MQKYVTIVCSGTVHKHLQGGAWCKKKKKNIVNIFASPPLQIAKKFQGPLFAMNITGQPHWKACKLNFYWKICGNFFQGPPYSYKGQKF